MNTIKYTAVARSDKGKIRSNNEDNFYFNGIHLNKENRDERNYYSESPSGSDFIYGVFDGMGGEALGEEASLIVAETVKKYHSKIIKDQALNNDETLLRIVEEANAKICDKMVETGERRIGTTFAAVSVQEDIAKVYNVGDSRVYLFRDKKLKQVSVDDTTAQRLVNMGVLSKEKAKTHEDRHKLTQHLGIFKDEMIVEPHISNEIEIKKGDVFLLCSDGLTDMVEDDKISEILLKAKNCEIAARKLIDAALNNGGRDNVTVVMLSADSSPTIKRGTQKKNNKFIVPLILALALVVSGLTIAHFVSNRNSGTTEEIAQVEATALKWANEIDEIAVGTSGSLIIQKEPANATGLIHWSSTNDDILTVNDKGFYTAKSAGEVSVIAQLDSIVCTIELNVVEKVIDIKPKEVTIYIGENERLEYEIIPSTSKQTIHFIVEDESIATINESGIITPLKIGKTTVTLKAGNFEKQVAIEVEEKKTKVDGIKQDKHNMHEASKADKNVTTSSNLYESSNTSSGNQTKNTNDDNSKQDQQGESKSEHNPEVSKTKNDNLVNQLQ